MLDPNNTEFIPIVSVASGSNEVSEDPPRAVIHPARQSDQPQASTLATPVVTSVSSTPTTSGTSSQAGHSPSTPTTKRPFSALNSSNSSFGALANIEPVKRVKRVKPVRERWILKRKVTTTTPEQTSLYYNKPRIEPPKRKVVEIDLFDSDSDDDEEDEAVLTDAAKTNDVDGIKNKTEEEIVADIVRKDLDSLGGKQSSAFNEMETNNDDDSDIVIIEDD